MLEEQRERFTARRKYNKRSDSSLLELSSALESSNNWLLLTDSAGGPSSVSREAEEGKRGSHVDQIRRTAPCADKTQPGSIMRVRGELTVHVAAHIRFAVRHFEIDCGNSRSSTKRFRAGFAVHFNSFDDEVREVHPCAAVRCEFPRGCARVEHPFNPLSQQDVDLWRDRHRFRTFGV